MNSEQTERHLRHLIIGLLHVGRLKPGDPLPSIRTLAKEVGSDHRTVAGAYRVLEAEGLVEIRPGSGVYLAGGVSAGMIQSATERWLSGVLLEGWRHRVARSEMATLVERCAASRVRCACIESNEDHMVAVSAELEDDFSLEVRPVLVAPAAEAASVPREALASADLVVTTVFHASVGRAVAARQGKPCIVLQVSPQFAAEIARRLARPVTAVISDRRYGARGREHLEVTPHRGNVRFVPVDEIDGSMEGGVVPDGEGVLMTRAARRKLGLPEYHLVPSPPTYISPDSARGLCGAIVALGLGAASAQQPGG